MVKQSDLDYKIIKQVFRNKLKSTGLGGSSCVCVCVCVCLNSVRSTMSIFCLSYTHAHIMKMSIYHVFLFNVLCFL